MISGMHASISTHLTNYHKDFTVPVEERKTFPNVDSYMEKVGNHPQRLSNLHFATYILLRAFNRYYPTVDHIPVSTGDFADDLRTSDLL